ncbi:reverse transcriptase domain-containing protein [Tanacetum coccineum]
MADDRPMAEQLQAPTGGFESAIVVPIINAQNFELKSSLINLVQNRIFRGGNDEEPHAHIRHFESITNNQRYPDVPNTTIKLLLFPFSLDGVAKTWLDKEPPNSILTWDDLVSKFINFFFPPSKTTNLRNEITNFRQIAQESFSEAWERFKELLRKCPHHGFSLMHQLDTFYNSLSYNDQDSLNSAAGGNFLYKSPTEGLQIIENKAKVRCSRNAVMRVSTNAPPPSSTSSSSNFEFQQMAAALEDKMTLTFRNEMNEMKNMMKALVPTPAPIKAVEERCTTCGSNHSFNVCPMTRGGYEYPVYHDNFQQFQQTASVGNFVQNGNSGYRTPNLANQIRPPDRCFDFNALSIKMLKSLLSTREVKRDGYLHRELKCKALADLGASINLMPLSVYTKLGLPALQSTRMTLELANCSLCVPKGIARDVLVPVGRLTFPADFVVVDFECDYRVPLILGRLFLRTARALIDVFGEEMSLRDQKRRESDYLCKK